MSNIIVVIIFILLILFLQIGIMPHIAISGAYPNLILISILCLSIIRDWKKVLPWTILGGLFLDFYSLLNILGISVIALLVVSYLVYFLSQNVFKKTTFFSLTSIFLVTLFIYNLLFVVFFRITDSSFNFSVSGFFIGIIYNFIFALPIFYLLKKYDAKFTKIQD